MTSSETRFLSVADIDARWSCSRAHVYRAIAEMEREGYLRRLLLGRVQRVAEASVAQYEARHATQPVDMPKSTIVGLRAALDGPRPSHEVSPAKGGKGLLEKWREQRGAAKIIHQPWRDYVCYFGTSTNADS